MSMEDKLNVNSCLPIQLETTKNIFNKNFPHFLLSGISKMNQDIFIKEEQFDLSDPLNIQENQEIPSEINEQVHERNKPYSCPLCDLSFSKSDNLQRHIARVHECSICNQSFVEKKDMKRHIKSVHEEKKTLN